MFENSLQNEDFANIHLFHHIIYVGPTLDRSGHKSTVLWPLVGV